MQIPAALERVLLTLWVGSLWSIGYIAAPTLFLYQDNRQLAGELAGHMFHTVSYIGLICGTALLIGLWRNTARNWRTWVIVLLLALVCIGEFILQPLMADLKAQGLLEGSAVKSQFGILHGIASIIYLIESLLGLSLLVFGLHPSSGRGIPNP